MSISGNNASIHQCLDMVERCFHAVVVHSPEEAADIRSVLTIALGAMNNIRANYHPPEPLKHVLSVWYQPERYDSDPVNQAILRTVVRERIAEAIHRCSLFINQGPSFRSGTIVASSSTLVVMVRSTTIVDPRVAAFSSALSSVRASGMNLEKLPDHFKKEPLIVFEAVKRSPAAFSFADRSLHENKSFVMTLMKQVGEAYPYLQGDLSLSKEIFREAVRSNGLMYRFVPKEWRPDLGLLKDAVCADIRVVHLLTVEEKANEVLAEVIVSGNGMAIQYLNTKFLGNKKIAMQAVLNDGMALQFFNPALRADKDVVRIAVRRDGRAIRFASDELRNDEAIGVAAMRQNPEAYEFIGENLRRNRRFQAFVHSLNQEQLDDASVLDFL